MGKGSEVAYGAGHRKKNAARMLVITVASLVGASLTVSLLVQLILVAVEVGMLRPLLAVKIALLSLAGMITSHLSIAGVASLLQTVARGGRDGP